MVRWQVSPFSIALLRDFHLLLQGTRPSTLGHQGRLFKSYGWFGCPKKDKSGEAMNYGQIVSFIWGVADLIRDTFKRGKYQDVILPLTVLRRLDCVLAPTKENVLQRQGKLRGRGLENLRRQLCDASGFEFYNTSRYDFDRLLADGPNVAANLRNYIAGFSPNPPKDTDGRREDSGRGWVRELQGRWPGVLG